MVVNHQIIPNMTINNIPLFTINQQLTIAKPSPQKPRGSSEPHFPTLPGRVFRASKRQIYRNWGQRMLSAFYRTKTRLLGGGDMPGPGTVKA